MHQKADRSWLEVTSSPLEKKSEEDFADRSFCQFCFVWFFDWGRDVCLTLRISGCRCAVYGTWNSVLLKMP